MKKPLNLAAESTLHMRAVNEMASEYIKDIRHGVSRVVMAPNHLPICRDADGGNKFFNQVFGEVLTEVLDRMIDRYNLNAEVKWPTIKTDSGVKEFVQLALLFVYNFYKMCDSDKPLAVNGVAYDFSFYLDITKKTDADDEDGKLPYLEFSMYITHEKTSRKLAYEVYF